MYIMQKRHGRIILFMAIINKIINELIKNKLKIKYLELKKRRRGSRICSWM